MRLVLLGAPGSGKGTQADMLKAKYGFVHISTGHILRKNLREKTELGLRAKPFMDKGELVPDEIIVGMVKERLSQDDVAAGFLMDGFPRDIRQAEAFERMLNETERHLDAVVLIKIDDELVVKRLTNRRTCRACGKVLNFLDLHAETRFCPDCGGGLYHRDDDCEQVINHRLEVYKEMTEPVAVWYESKGLLYSVEVEESSYPEDTFEKIETALGL